MTDKNRVLDIDIERYALGELPPDRAEAVKATLAADPEAEAKLRAIEADNRAILDAYPPHLMAVQIRERAEHAAAKRSAARRRILVPAMSLCAAGAAALVVMVLLPNTGPGDVASGGDTQIQTEPGIRTKGLAPKLFMYRLGDNGKEPLETGQAVNEGDIIQWSFAALGKKYGVIFSLDGRGAVTLHYPNDAAGSTQLATGTNELDFSYELDDAPKFERFFFVTSMKPIDVKAVLERGQNAGESGQLALVGDQVSSDFVLKKSR